MSADAANLGLLVGAAVVIVAIAAVRFSHRAGLPGLLVYLGLGLLLGEAGAGVRFDDAQLTQSIGLTALALILAEGGLTTRWQDIRSAVPTAVALATVGIAVSVGVVAAAAHWLLGTDWRLALLLGAILAPTDAAAVFSVLRRLPLPRRLAGVLEAESGFNDAPAVILVVILSTGGTHDPLAFGGTVVYELVVGTVIGFVVGPLGAYALRRVALPASGLYPIAVLALTMVAYASAAMIHTSGFLAVYVAALVLGNSGLPHRAATRGFAESIALLTQIGLFLVLGLLASPAELPGEILRALLLGTVLVLFARPIAVLASTVPLRAAGLALAKARTRRDRRAREERYARARARERERGQDERRRARERIPARDERDGRRREPPGGGRSDRPAGGRSDRPAGGAEPAGPSARPDDQVSWWREQAFLSWAGLRGAVPIVLATVPITTEIAGSDQLFAQVFVIVVIFTLLQGPTLPLVARWCRVTAPAEAMELDVEAGPLGVIAADLLEVRIPPDSRLQGVEIFELRLPRQAAITLIVRDGHNFVPGPSTVLRAGDELLVVAGAGARQATERRLRAVSRAGRLAAWLGERGE